MENRMNIKEFFIRATGRNPNDPIARKYKYNTHEMMDLAMKFTEMKCKEQKDICADIFSDLIDTRHHVIDIEDDIRNAPLATNE